MHTAARLSLAALAALALGAAPAAAQKLTFTLNWVAGGDHAPYFYAQKMGWYKQAGIDVEFETGRGSAASAQKVGAGASQLGLSDMAGVLLFRGKGLDLVGLMNVYANSPQGLYWLKSSGINGLKDLAGKKIGNPAGDGARTMWPALAKANGIDPNSVTWVNIDANAKLGALKAKTVDATTSFFNLHHVFARELGSDMGFVAWKDAGINPYGNSIIANGAWLKANRDKAAEFIKVTQKAFADCAKTPEPCIRALVEANGALLYDNELTNWHLVVDPDERRDLAHRRARLARRQPHGGGLQTGRRVSQDGEAVRRQDGLHQRVPRQVHQDAADQSAEAVLIERKPARSCTAQFSAGPSEAETCAEGDVRITGLTRTPGRSPQRCGARRRSSPAPEQHAGERALRREAGRFEPAAQRGLRIGEIDDRPARRSRSRPAASSALRGRVVLGDQRPEMRGGAAVAAEQQPGDAPVALGEQIGRRQAPAHAREDCAAVRAEHVRVVGAERRPDGVGDRLHRDPPSGCSAGAAVAAVAGGVKLQASLKSQRRVDRASGRRRVEHRHQSGRRDVGDAAVQQPRREPAPAIARRRPAPC